MNVNGQQVQTNTNGAPIVPDETPKFPLGDDAILDGADWGLDFDEETGRIKITGAQPASTPPPTNQGITEEPVDPAANPNASQQNGNKSPDDGRIAKLEGVVQQLVGIVAGMAAGQGSNNLNQGEQQQQQYDLSDQNQMAAYINQSITAAMKPVMDFLPKIVERVTYQDARTKYGSELDEAMSHFGELVAGGAMTAEKAVELYKGIKGANGNQSATTHGANQTQVPKQSGPAQALISKANQVQTHQGVNGTVANGKPDILNVRDALNAAYEQLSRG